MLDSRLLWPSPSLLLQHVHIGRFFLERLEEILLHTHGLHNPRTARASGCVENKLFFEEKMCS